MEEELKNDHITGSPQGECSEKPRRKVAVFPSREQDLPIRLSASVSAHDLRSLELEKESRGERAEPSPGGVLEDCCIRSSDSETVSSKASTSYAEVQVARCQVSMWRGFFQLWRKKSMQRLSSFPPFGVPKLSRRRMSSTEPLAVPRSSSTHGENNEYCLVKPCRRNFTLAELQKATNDFSPDNIIGKGGYAEVYKGRLENGEVVAIKRLNRGTSDERTKNFLTELGITVHVNHPNTAKLIGLGVDGGMHLVLQLSPHGSLANLLHGSKSKLNWDVRYKVALGTAKGLEYLHEKCPRRIIHRDIKAANILLTEEFEPQISDFGLAKWLPDKLTHHTVSSFEGTFGYLAPEYCTHGIVDEKTDVYSYGVLLLELITGRKALDTSKQSLVMWVKPFLEKNQWTTELLDPSFCDSYDSKQVVKLLSSEEDPLESKNIIQKSLIRRTYSEELHDAEEYNATRYLSDISRHKKLAFDF
ncbi:Receptor-like cytosolic serine/threonine-protein kinase RBK2 [Ananas comosus]|uniref:non-specific serine/threonine protein kinase n=1 Tax=Ananas comosus TaxID=4615 RepID=A0A199V281_ANACO|nr:Receptor-like cytosolic serine/threonine-protein kinase RBK2 [Ananas comosus]